MVPSISSSTSSTLLARVRQNEPQAWSQLCQVYAPLVYACCRRAGLQDSDALDVGQEVFHVVADRIGAFRRESQSDSFSGWVWGITRNKLREHFRRRPGAVGTGGSAALRRMHDLTDVAPERFSDRYDLGIRATLVRRVMDAIRGDFDDKTFRAFWRSAIDAQSSTSVADELEMTPGAVRQAKFRVLRRLREELADLE